MHMHASRDADDNKSEEPLEHSRRLEKLRNEGKKCERVPVKQEFRRRDKTSTLAAKLQERSAWDEV